MVSTTNPTTVLMEIHAEIVKLDEEEETTSVNVIEEFVKRKVIIAMRKVDPLFDKLFQRVYHTGSFYDRLRIGKADEFDLNLILDIKELLPTLEFQSAQVDPGFVRVVVKPEQFDSRKPDWMKLWPDFQKALTEKDPLNGKTHLMPMKVRRWFESIVKRAEIEQLRIPGITSVKVTKSGPAMTLKIATRGHQSDIDVDLVPTFIFGCESLANYPEIFQVLNSNKWTSQRFFIIPKPSKKMSRDADKFWRLDFHEIEREVIKSAGFSRNVVRLLKVFRNSNQPLEGISSYALKGLVMLMIRDSKLTWNEANLPMLFLEALKFLKERLSRGMIPYYFHHQCNLLWSMNEQRKKEMATWLTKHIERLEKSKGTKECRAVWRSYFGLQD